MKPVRLGLIGAGKIGRVHARAALALRSSGAVELVAVHDIDPRAATAVADNCACEGLPLDVMLHGAELDAVILATPPDSHEALALQFLELGVAVLCEKPIAPDMAGVDRLMRAARRTGSPFGISSKFLFASGVAETIAGLDNGSLGRAKSLSLNFSTEIDLSGRWYVDRRISGGGVLADRGPQAFDLIHALLGRPVALRACAAPSSPYPVEDVVVLEIETADGSRATCDLSWRAGVETDVYARLATDTAEIELGWRQCRLRHQGGEWQALGSGYDQGQAFQAQLAAFVDHVRVAEPFVDLAISHAVAVAIDTAYRSGLTGRVMTLPGLAPAIFS